MLTVTDAAAEHLSEMLEEAKAPDDTAIRFVPGKAGLEMKLDKPIPADTTFDHDGRTVLMVSQKVAERLGEQTLDVEPAPDGKGKLLKLQ